MALDRVVDSANLNAGLKEIAVSIRTKIGETEELAFPGGFRSGVDKVFSAGGKSVYDRFWDIYQNNGKRTNYNTVFGGQGWNDITFCPKYDIRPTVVNSAAQIFQMSGIADLKGDLERAGVVLDLSKAYNSAQNLFVNCYSLLNTPELNLAKCYTITGAFQNCSKLVTVDKLVLSEALTTFGTAFNEATALENIIFEGVIACNGLNLQWSINLSKASITSVVNALATTTSGLSVSFSKIAVNNAFETAEGASDGSSSEEWAVLANTKSNWTINLV